jgi:hypothetical protein
LAYLNAFIQKRRNINYENNLNKSQFCQNTDINNPVCNNTVNNKESQTDSNSDKNRKIKEILENDEVVLKIENKNFYSFLNQISNSS